MGRSKQGKQGQTVELSADTLSDRGAEVIAAGGSRVVVTACIDAGDRRVHVVHRAPDDGPAPERGVFLPLEEAVSAAELLRRLGQPEIAAAIEWTAGPLLAGDLLAARRAEGGRS